MNDSNKNEQIKTNDVKKTKQNIHLKTWNGTPNEKIREAQNDELSSYHKMEVF